MSRALLALALLPALAVADAADNRLTPWTAGPPGGEWSAPWRVADIPKLEAPQRSLVERDGRLALHIRADAAAGGLLHPLDLPGDRPWQLSWQWRSEGRLEQARFATREGDDYAARVYVLLDYPLDELPFLTRQKLRLARTFYDPSLPAATLSYVWDNRRAPGSHARSAYTEQVEMRVLRGPEAPLGQWLEERRDLRADAIAAFGSAPSRILGVVFAADSDNTGERVESFFAAPHLQPAAP
ncbi:DUF3047 domain-containing protein [Pseudomonas benzenivorans]|uniref:DUF3047 domain-containing protein n=1 Tax=Pseudomonas benzenivorans TaxID=556533 RepID=A0ABY5H4U8_9PSED|nr:DUF3047 domain-containing protein [Pseudomonas benzenivorans]UTW06096.1 DUF3047 domain-containing protein [Pseudomonas benzenivorans]